MTTLIFTHTDCLAHDTGPGHPEHAGRLRTVLQLLDEEFPDLTRRDAPEATVEQLERVHDPHYVRHVLDSIPAGGYRRLDPDTVLSPGSRPAILRAAGAVCAAVDAVLSGEADTAFCAVRPCGHHAEPDRAKGFCLFNNVAVGAQQARAVHGLRRVAVVDFDVHHGNGTQAMFWSDPDLFFGSSHQWPFYPGTGAREERGQFANIVNLPLPAFSGSTEFRAGMAETVLPELDRFAPELILISAGFDADARDPLAQLRLQPADFAWITNEVMGLARRHCGGKAVSVLEGGYGMDGLAEGCAAHLRSLVGG